MKKWILLIIATLFPQAIWAADIGAVLQWSQRVELSTPVSGVVKTVDVKVGERVAKGRVLLSLDDTVYQARVVESKAEILRLKAEADEDKRELERVLELHDRTVVATTELDQAKLRVTRSKSRLSEAKARLTLNQKFLDDASIRAPFDAIVILRNAEPGQSVAAGLQPPMLLTLAKDDEMIARIYLSVVQIRDLDTGQKVKVNFADKSYAAEIKTLGFEPVNKNGELKYQVDVTFPVSDSLRAGSPATVTLP